MAKFAKVLAMIVRVFFVVELVLGVLLAGARLQYLEVHIGSGIRGRHLRRMLLAIMACVKGACLESASSDLFLRDPSAVAGFEQFPLKFGAQIGLIQIVHVLVALAAVGLAEALHARLRKTA